MSRVLVFVMLLGCGPQVVTEEHRAAAQAIWKERCANCHGVHGRGDGPGAALLPVHPRNFADRHWKEAADDARLAQVIVDGGKAVGLDGNMAANPDLRTKPEVVAALVEIVRGW